MQSQAYPRPAGSEYLGLKPGFCGLTNPRWFSCRFQGWSKAVVVNSAACQDCLGKFKKFWCLRPTPCVWLIWSGYSLVIKTFLSSRGNLNRQPWLRISGLKLPLLPYVKGILPPASFWRVCSYSCKDSLQNTQSPWNGICRMRNCCFFGIDSPIWKLVAEVKENIHIFERKPSINLEWKHEIL